MLCHYTSIILSISSRLVIILCLDSLILFGMCPYNHFLEIKTVGVSARNIVLNNRTHAILWMSCIGINKYNNSFFITTYSAIWSRTCIVSTFTRWGGIPLITSGLRFG